MKLVNGQIPIGGKCLLVSREFAYKNRAGGVIIPSRLRTYVNIHGDIQPVFTEIGNSRKELTLKTHIVFVTLQRAIDAIQSKHQCA